MDQNVELTSESLAGPGKSSVELLIVLHVTWKDRGAGYLGGQVAHVLLHTILVGKGEVSAFACKRLGDSPANGTMIGNTENKCVFSFKQGHFVYSSQVVVLPVVSYLQAFMIASKRKALVTAQWDSAGQPIHSYH